ncbi:phage scaffolding protein [Lysinibacillus xylanilyticus]|uniref:phage scaffolding protein n=1 Tax=Lysinibacillus xylanilyticus TaxID=582475 RepID=UPI002E22BFD9|nr:phage scaffolding protein [Lysinibacillus xylanilyticus]
MEWLRALIQEQGVSNEQIEKIVASAAKESPKHVIPKDKYNELSTAKSLLDTQLMERDTQLTELQKQVKGNEELENTIKELQATNKTAKEKYDADMLNQKIESAIDLALTGAKARNLTATKSLLDREGLSLDKDGKTVIGLEDKVKALIESEDTKFMFASDETVITGTTPGGQPGGGGSPVDTSTMTYSQLVAYQEANPEAKI